VNGGVTVHVSDVDATESLREVRLPSGGTAMVRCGRGRDLRLAQMAVGQPFDELRCEFALIARLITIDGRKITMEEVDEMPIRDVLALQQEVDSVNFPRIAAGASESST
jgi:hypothetical protein